MRDAQLPAQPCRVGSAHEMRRLNRQQRTWWAESSLPLQPRPARFGRCPERLGVLDFSSVRSRRTVRPRMGCRGGNGLPRSHWKQVIWRASLLKPSFYTRDCPTAFRSSSALRGQSRLFSRLLLPRRYSGPRPELPLPCGSRYKTLDSLVRKLYHSGTARKLHGQSGRRDGRYASQGFVENLAVGRAYPTRTPEAFV